MSLLLRLQKSVVLPLKLMAASHHLLLLVLLLHHLLLLIFPKNNYHWSGDSTPITLTAAASLRAGGGFWVGLTDSD
jgi:hypothetical protein